MSELLSVDLGPNEKAEELVKRVSIDKTPFTMIILEDVCFGALGAYRITESYDLSEQDALEEDLKAITWDRLIQVIYIIQDQKEEISNLIKEDKK